MGAVLYLARDFVVLECYSCGIAFAITDQKNTRLRNSGDSFWCPNGHSQKYLETEVARLQKKLAQQEHHTQFYKNQYEYAQKKEKTLKREKAALKGNITKLRNRAAAGVCPCCTRHFTNLERHMKSKHPGFNKEK